MYFTSATAKTYATMAIAEAETVPSYIDVIVVNHDGLLLEYQRDASGSALTTLGGANWSPFRDTYPEHFGATGVGDDTAALQAAAAWVGEDGTLHNSGRHYTVTSRDLVQCTRTGTGTITVDGKTYKWATEQEVRSPEISIKNVEIDNEGYSHFPQAMVGAEGNVGAVYYSGENHGQSDKEAVCLPQAVVGAGALTINGNYAVTGEVVLGAGAGDGTGATRMRVTSTGDETGVTFTVVGTYAGGPVSCTITGVNANTVNSLSTEVFDTITSVTADGACSGNISVGLWMLPSDIKFAVTRNGGASFEKFIIANGSTNEDIYHYAIFGASNREGMVSVGYLRFPIEEFSKAATTWKYFVRVSRDMAFFSPEAEMVFTGITPSSTLNMYRAYFTPSDRMIFSAYSGTDTFLLRSDDLGRNVEGKVAFTGAYSEAAIGMVDANDMVMVTRVNSSTTKMRQYHLANVDDDDIANVTATYTGDTSLELSGGWISPAIAKVKHQGKSYFVLAVQARDSASLPPETPDSYYAMVAECQAVLSNSSLWSDHDVWLEGTTGGNSGYGSIVPNAAGELIMIYGDEADAKNAAISYLGTDGLGIKLFEEGVGGYKKVSLTTVGDILFNSVTATVTAVDAVFIRNGDLVDAIIEIDYTGLDTADDSQISLRTAEFPFPVSRAIRGSVDLENSTGLTFAASDTVHADFAAANAIVQLNNAAGTAWAYNSGKIDVAGKIITHVSYLTE